MYCPLIAVPSFLARSGLGTMLRCMVPVPYPPPRIRPRLANRTIVRYLPSLIAASSISGDFCGCEDLSDRHGVLGQLLKYFFGIYSPVPNWLAAVSIMSRKPFEAVSCSLYAFTGLAWRGLGF